MIRALLLDLDDTLLINDWHTFFPPYLESLCAHMEAIIPSERFVPALNAGLDAMFSSEGHDGLLEQVFMSTFLPLAGTDAEVVLPHLAAYYRNGFNDLAQYTAQDPAAVELVSLARERGLKLAIATQPIFPLEAVQARLRWAGVPDKTFGYEYVATFDTQRACKPAAIFYADILGRLGVAPPQAMMVGDSARSDMAAGAFGLKTFYIDRGRDEGGQDVVADARGSLADIVNLLRTGAIDEL